MIIIRFYYTIVNYNYIKHIFIHNIIQTTKYLTNMNIGNHIKIVKLLNSRYYLLFFVPQTDIL